MKFNFELLKRFQGKFITFEGIEGSGKSSNAKYIANFLNQAGVKTIYTREPGGTAIAEQIREILLSHRDETVLPVTELLLLFAARAQHLQQVIKPALRENNCVICDRFTDASYAYQGGGRRIEYNKIAALEQLVQGQFRPDCTVLLDIAVEIGMQRVQQRNSNCDRIEVEQSEFFERVRTAYLAQADRYANRYLIIDSSIDLVKLQSNLIQQIINFFKWQ